MRESSLTSGHVVLYVDVKERLGDGSKSTDQDGTQSTEDALHHRRQVARSELFSEADDRKEAPRQPQVWVVVNQEEKFTGVGQPEEQLVFVGTFLKIWTEGRGDMETYRCDLPQVLVNPLTKLDQIWFGMGVEEF